MKKIGKMAVDALGTGKNMLLERSEMKKILGGRLYYCKCSSPTGYGNNLYDYYYDYDDWEEMKAKADYDCYIGMGVWGATCVEP